MAKEINDTCSPIDFHPCDTPRGMLYYNMDVLTDQQQEKLNDLKRQTVAEDEKYLASRPEIRACVAIIMREVLKERPRSNIHNVIASYFSQNRDVIEADVAKYIKLREPHKYESDSYLDLYSTASTISSKKLAEGASLDKTRSFTALDAPSHNVLSEFGSFDRKALGITSETELTESALTELIVRKLIAKNIEEGISAKETDRKEELLRIQSYQNKSSFISMLREKARRQGDGEDDQIVDLNDSNLQELAEEITDDIVDVVENDFESDFNPEMIERFGSSNIQTSESVDFDQGKKGHTLEFNLPALDGEDVDDKS